MAETDLHRILMTDLIDTLQYRYIDIEDVYVSGNLLLYYVEGDKRRHVAPDVFVTFGVMKRVREYYLLWQERKPPSVIIEVTSSSTKREDTDKKFVLYRDVIKVKEYFLFDPRGDYLEPRLRGFRLRGGEYQPIALVDGRMPSKMLGLHLETVGQQLRLFDPATKLWLPTSVERAEQEKERAELAERESVRLAEENERLRRQLEQFTQGRKNGR